jgi:hypothetical protein
MRIAKEELSMSAGCDSILRYISADSFCLQEREHT